MLRILIALGSVLLEIATVMTEGAMAVSMLVAGTIITLIHSTATSQFFRALVNRLSGFDLPESLESASSAASRENLVDN